MRTASFIPAITKTIECRPGLRKEDRKTPHTAYTRNLETDSCYNQAVAKNDVVELEIESIAPGGDGFTRLNGKSIFTAGTAAGERVCCRISEEHNSWARAELLDIIEASPDRREPLCALYGICGGCNLQHINYRAQLAAKTRILKDCFTRIGAFVPPAPEVLPSPEWEYRNRMQFHRYRNTRVGLKARKGTELIVVSDCPVADPMIRQVLRDSGEGKYILSQPPEKDRFTVYARKELFLSEGGKRRGRTRLLDRDITLDTEVFFQSNGAVLEKLIADLREIVSCHDKTDPALPMADMFCGVGTFAVFLGELFSRLDLVEENKNALALARENLSPLITAGLKAEFFALKDENWVKNRGGKAGQYGFIVLDPPRQGMNAALAHWLAEKGPPLMAYVSCDPATLARDSKILLAGGYELARLRLYDFYPQTAHIESLALFSRPRRRTFG